MLAVFNNQGQPGEGSKIRNALYKSEVSLALLSAHGGGEYTCPVGSAVIAVSRWLPSAAYSVPKVERMSRSEHNPRYWSDTVHESALEPCPAKSRRRNVMGNKLNLGQPQYPSCRRSESFGEACCFVSGYSGRHWYEIRVDDSHLVPWAHKDDFPI